MMKLTKKIFALLFIILSLLSVTACGNSATVIKSTTTGLNLLGDFHYEGNTYTTIVDKDTRFYNFNNKIIVEEGESYKIYKDIEGVFEVSTNILSLSVGDNICYVELTDKKGNKSIYKVNVILMSLEEVYYA